MTNTLGITSLTRVPVSGSVPALVTPMNIDGTLDIATLHAMVDWHIEEGTSALVVMGSTGESATLDSSEHCQMVREVVEHAAGRLPVIAGTGANSTREALELTRYAKDVGADAVLSVTPYYNRPTQEGLYQHYRKIAENVEIPLIVYNVPGRTGVDLADDTVLRLAEIPGIAGLKDATGDIARGTKLLHMLPNNFSVYSGDDETAAALMLLGAKGNISVTANVIPGLMRKLCDAARNGDVPLVRLISRKVYLLNQALFVQSNPIPVKWALARMGRMTGTLRLPLTPLGSEWESVLVRALALAGVELPAQ
ncbi:4-hydroxy-tetrahydrodipicolinate synthase [Cupriavidus sp. YR651]|uniref:4-hydroxy-tetrahydrodipicolinate synthase n=1 Tax=Cupriavidus sp. YR651 TaxID=1855315 RepID=UPI00087F06FF|nr:4-hydroxy-tetrahydrodipicolinate synthase [Cupriavidus sp. YR651]SDD95988.1 4-hydroxy-tetrahydrodipicolinate synthase [Cupriavidus sp. YR651]